MRTRVKICGLGREADVAVAVDAGADAIGLVFHEASPRFVDIERARALCRAVPPFVTIVGLFLDEYADWVAEVCRAVPLDLLQFHGTESPAYCQSFQRRYIKALGLGGGGTANTAADHGQAAGFLLDGHAPGEQGGSGQRFDWRRVAGLKDRHWILAGGLTAENVAEAVQAARPYAVDVSSGVEQSPGIKDPDKITAFINEVDRVR